MKTRMVSFADKEDEDGSWCGDCARIYEPEYNPPSHIIMTIKDHNDMFLMLQRVVDELNDPPRSRWGYGDIADTVVLDALCKDVEKLLEEM